MTNANPRFTRLRLFVQVSAILLCTLLVGFLKPSHVFADPIKLTPALTDGMFVREFSVSPDSQYAVYELCKRLDEENENCELHSVPLYGGPSTRLTPPLSATTNAGGLEITPDSQRVVYHLWQNNSAGLYSVPIGGPATAAVKLSQGIPVVADVNSSVLFIISADSMYVVYTAGEENTDPYETVSLYSVPITGPVTANLPLLGSLPTGQKLYQMSVTPDSQRVLFQLNDPVKREITLYSVPMTGPINATVQLSEPTFYGIEVYNLGLHLTSNGQRALYHSSDRSTSTPANADMLVLHSVPAAGPLTTELRLSPLMNGYPPFQISRDEQWVVYATSQPTNTVAADTKRALWRVPIVPTTTLPIQLTGEVDYIDDYELSQDARFVVYNEVQTSSGFGPDKLYSVPAAGLPTARIQLSVNSAITPTQVLNVAISADSRNVVYGDEATHSLYSVPITGPVTATIRLTMAENLDLLGASLTSQHVIYSEYREGPNKKLYSVPITGPVTATVQLSENLVEGGGISGYAISSNNFKLVYRAEQEVDGQFELYVVDLIDPATLTVRTYLPLLRR